MIKLEKNGVKTPWISENYKESELKRLTIDQLLLLCRYKPKIGNSFKTTLINHLLKK